jgi:membrane associated rhomboid family serine protease
MRPPCDAGEAQAVFIPLYDRNPRVLIARPWVTWGLILVYGLGLIPATLVGGSALHPELHLVAPAVTLVTYMFLHGGLLHLGGNMLFLWVFGDNIEDAMGHGRFIAFFVLGGAVAGLAQALVEPGLRVPIIGASGAIAAVLGAYLVLHPRAKILVPILVFPVYLPAVLPLMLWIAFQVFTAMSAGGGAGGVAWWAHVGGFLAGALLIVPFRHNAVPLFGVGELPGGLRLRRGWRRGSAPGGGPWDQPR